MGLFDRGTPAEALEAFLDRERDAILAGRFDVLERLGAEKERLVRLIARADRPDPSLQRLRRGAERNGALLQAMESGLRSAASRIGALQKGSPALQTYDSSGQKQPLPAGSTRLHRRA
jgi:flagellar biosynthesis/type III secretory pathway chaperone